MHCLKYYLFVFAFNCALFNSVQCKKVCDFKDIECTTRPVKMIYKIVIAGLQGLTEPLDPLHIDEIKGELENVKYELTNVTLTGLRNCEVLKFVINREESNYEHNMICSKLIVTYNYEAKASGPLKTAEKGSGSVTAVDYEMKIKGKYGKTSTSNDPVLHFYIDTHTLFTIPKGQVTIETKSNNNADKSKFAQILAHTNEDINEIDKKYVRSPVMDKFIALLMKNVDIIIRTMPADQIFTKDD